MADNNPSTIELDYFRSDSREGAVPGVLLAFLGDTPRFLVHLLADGALEIGRATPVGPYADDPTLSRRHARVRRAGDHFEVEDLGSRNGLVVDGVHVAPGQRTTGPARVVRVGHAVLVLEEDVRPLLAGSVTVDGELVVGPRLGRLWQSIDAVAATSEVLHVHGESGAGKELAAQRFHRAGAAGAPFVPVNCAAIPEGVAERMLFGARRGAFSGAHADATGLLQAADGGTLFLDEVGELDLEVQAKLLRVLETGEVLPVGAVKPQAVRVRIVSATHQDLRAKVSARAFREDLFFRIGRPEVTVPPLRERPEEVAWLVDLAARAISPTLRASPALVEQCLLRPWPGNVRELVLEVRDAARRASLAASARVEPEHLDAEAGRPHASEEPAPAASRPRIDRTMLPDRDTIEAALRAANGRVATAARNLGVHRNQLRRWLDEHGRPDTDGAD